MTDCSTDDRIPLLKGNSSESNNTNFQGRTHPPEKHTSRTFVVLCILITELCERMAYFGISANLVPFCRNVLGMTYPLPSRVVLIFQGFCYLFPIFGGWIGDKYTGRFNLILLCSLIYFAGILSLSVVSVKDQDFKKITNGSYLEPSYKTAYFIVALVFLAFGTGGIKANVSPFGADQVRDLGPTAIQRFFNWFYWFINIGAIFSFTIIAYVQQEYGFFYGSIIITSSMLLSIIAFCMSRNRYEVKSPGGSVFGDVFKVIWVSIKKTRMNERPIPRIKGDSWLDRAKETRGGHFSCNQVEDVKALLRVIPVLAVFIVYWLIYSQASNLTSIIMHVFD